MIKCKINRKIALFLKAIYINRLHVLQWLNYVAEFRFYLKPTTSGAGVENTILGSIVKHSVFNFVVKLLSRLLNLITKCLQAIKRCRAFYRSFAETTIELAWILRYILGAFYVCKTNWPVWQLACVLPQLRKISKLILR